MLAFKTKFRLTDKEASGQDFAVDAQKGHALLGQACYKSIMTYDQKSHPCSAGGESQTFHQYALRFGLAHLCLSKSTPLLEDLVLKFDSLWNKAYANGK